MAQKRMFSLSVVDTDRFLDMPVSARLLYYELGMRADDDGFIGNWKKILLFTGLKEDDLRILIAKQYLIPFENGVIVIKHWRMNNYLQSDRTKPTIYQQELQQLSLKNNNVYNLDTKCIHSIDKNSIDKISIEENSINNGEVLTSCSPNVEILEKSDLEKEFDKLWEYYPNKKGKDQALDKYIKARKSGTTYDEVAQGLKNYIRYCNHEKTEKRFIKHGSTWFRQKCWKDDYTISTQTKSTKSNNQMEILKGVYDGTIKVN